MLALRRITTPNASDWQRGRLRGVKDITKLTTSMMNEFSDPKGLSVWLATNDADIEIIAAAITLTHGKACSDSVFAVAKWSEINLIANTKETLGGTLCPKVDALHREIEIPNHGVHVAVVSKFIDNPSVFVAAKTARDRAISLIKANSYNISSLIKSMPKREKLSTIDSLLQLTVDGVMEFNLSSQHISPNSLNINSSI